MATLRQATERARSNGVFPIGASVGVKNLLTAFHPSPRGSVRALLANMTIGVTIRRPWAVILCRFKNAAADPALEGPVERLYREMFSSGAGGIVEYWRDASLGAIDVAASRVFGWVEIDIERKDAGVGSGVGRSILVDKAIAAAKAAGYPDPTVGFFSQIAVLVHNWTKDDVPGGTAGVPDWSNPMDQRIPFWIDGSTDGRGKVTLTPPHNGNVAAHEMGHGFGMHHDIGPDFKTHYFDPCCIMSQQNGFQHPRLNVAFGPALCLPHLLQRGWMYTHRVYQDDGRWQSQPGGVSIPLAPLNDAGARANLGAKLPFRTNTDAWDYYLEYVKPDKWNRGLVLPYVFVRRFKSLPGYGDMVAFLGLLQVPPAPGTTTEFIEPQGNVNFTVEHLISGLRSVKVTAVAL
jgi:hypothetical protein